MRFFPLWTLQQGGIPVVLVALLALYFCPASSHAQTLNVIRPGAARIGLPQRMSPEEAPDEAFSAIRDTGEERREGGDVGDTSDTGDTRETAPTTAQSTEEPPSRGLTYEETLRSITVPPSDQSHEETPTANANRAKRGAAAPETKAIDGSESKIRDGKTCNRDLASEDIASLYKEGMVLVRFLNLIEPEDSPSEGEADTDRPENGDGGDEIKIAVGKARLSSTYGVESPYIRIRHGELMTVIKDKSQNLALFPGEIYTIVARGTASQPVIDAIHDSPPRSTSATVSVYNLTDYEALALSVNNGKTTLIPAITPNLSKSVQLRELSAILGIKQAGGTSLLADLPATEFKREKTYSVFVTPVSKDSELVSKDSEFMSNDNEEDTINARLSLSRIMCSTP